MEHLIEDKNAIHNMAEELYAMKLHENEFVLTIMAHAHKRGGKFSMKEWNLLENMVESKRNRVRELN